MTTKEIQKDLKNKLKPARYEHTLACRYCNSIWPKSMVMTAQRLHLAGLLHDCAKYMADDIKNRTVPGIWCLYQRCGIQKSVSSACKMRSDPGRTRIQIIDFDILHAIRVHTTGVPDMSLLDKIIFIADYIEPNRDNAPHLKELRKLADKDLDETTYLILKDTVDYLKSSRRSDHGSDYGFPLMNTTETGIIARTGKESEQMNDVSRNMAKIACHATF